MRFHRLAILLCIIFSLAVVSACGSKPTPTPAQPPTGSQSTGSTYKGPYFGQEPPGVTPEPFAPQVFVPRETHSGPTFSLDGTEVWWSDNGGGGVSFMKMKDGTWSRPTSCRLNGCFDSPIFAPDGKMFFVSRTEDIYYVERSGEGWRSPVALPSCVNNLSNHWQLSVAENGDLYWGAASSVAVSDYQADIYKASLVNGRYVNASIVKEGISTPEAMENCPFIAKDGSYLIFVRLTSNDSTKLYISFRKADGSWNEPVAFGEDINPPKTMTQCPTVTPDGKYFFFLRNYTPYWVDAKVIEMMRPK